MTEIVSEVLQNIHRIAASSDIELGIISKHSVVHNVIVAWAGRTLNGTVGHEIEVASAGLGNTTINNSAVGNIASLLQREF